MTILNQLQNYKPWKLNKKCKKVILLNSELSRCSADEYYYKIENGKDVYNVYNLYMYVHIHMCYMLYL